MGTETILLVLAIVVGIAIFVGGRRAKRRLGDGNVSANKSPPAPGGVS